MMKPQFIKGWVEIEILKGLTINSIKEVVDDENNDVLILISNKGRIFQMDHSQSCCESVYIEDIDGDLEDLLNSPITMAEEVQNNTDDLEVPTCEDSYTWTFYKIGTAKGSVTIRWFGASNGCYSEEVDFYEVKVEDE